MVGFDLLLELFCRYHPFRHGFDEFFGFTHEGHYFVPPPYKGVTTLLRLKQVQSENLEADSSSSAEGLRRLLLALVKDVRVVLIALAWQLARLRLAKTASEQARALAHEAFIIHAPLANRLGVWQLKWEIEDLAFRFEDPEAYPGRIRQFGFLA